MLRCARCRRPLTREPVIVAGAGYGSVCAAKVGDLLTQLPKRARIVTRRRRASTEPDLFAGVAP